MKIGNLVKKVSGDYQIGKIGIIVNIHNSDRGDEYLILDVHVEEKIVAWAAHLTEVIDE